VTRLAGNLTAEQIDILRQHIAKESTARNSREAISVRLATEFHTILAEMTGSPVLTRYVQEICRRCGLTMTLYARPHSSECAINEHMEIVDTLAKGDVEAAIRIMHYHLEEVANRALISPVNAHTTSLMDVLAPYASGSSANGGGDERKAGASKPAKLPRRKAVPRKPGRR
jgi:DNA-binding GntR family transcriptional regulator